MKKILFALPALFLCLSASAQENDPVKDFQEFRKDILSDYNGFREKVLGDYFEFLKTSWADYESQKPIEEPRHQIPDPPVPYVEPPVVEPQPEPVQPPVVEPQPEPVQPPVVEPQPEPVQPEPVQPMPVQPEPIQPPVIEPQPEPIIDDIRKDIPRQSVACDPFEFSYMNTPMTVTVKRGPKIKLTSANGEAMADFIKQYADNSNDAMVKDCLSIRQEKHLCDWAYLNMLLSFSRAYYGSDCNESTMLAAYLYLMSGYKMRLAVDHGKVYLLYASRHVIYNQSYFQVDGLNLYSVGDKCPTSASICDAPFPQEMPLSLIIQREPLFAVSETAARNLHAAQYEDMNFTVSTNKNLIEFYNSYPSSEINHDPGTRWAMYANTPFSEIARKKLYPAMESAISGLGKREAVGHILNWVQTAFVYEYDNKVWGDDRAFFPEETIYYPYSDCEDRSILFSRLVLDLTGLEAVLVSYTGHLAAAVKLPDAESEGDYFLVGGTKYTICDPTFIGAPVGMSMPKYKSSSAQIIKLR